MAKMTVAVLAEKFAELESLINTAIPELRGDLAEFGEELDQRLTLIESRQDAASEWAREHAASPHYGGSPRGPRAFTDAETQVTVEVVESGIRCGNAKCAFRSEDNKPVKHASVEQVRACYAGRYLSEKDSTDETSEEETPSQQEAPF